MKRNKRIKARIHAVEIKILGSTNKSFFVKILESEKRKSKPNWTCMLDFLYFLMKETQVLEKVKGFLKQQSEKWGEFPTS